MNKCGKCSKPVIAFVDEGGVRYDCDFCSYSEAFTAALPPAPVVPRDVPKPAPSPSPFISYESLIAQAQNCQRIAHECAGRADYERAAKFRRYWVGIIDLIEIDLRSKGFSWDVSSGRGTHEMRLDRIKAMVNAREGVRSREALPIA